MSNLAPAWKSFFLRLGLGEARGIKNQRLRQAATHQLSFKQMETKQLQ